MIFVGFNFVVAAAKIVQTEGKTKQTRLFFLPRCSLSYQKIVKYFIFALSHAGKLREKLEFVIPNTERSNYHFSDVLVG